MAASSQASSIVQALIDLRDQLAGVELGLEVLSADAARDMRREIVAQIDDYLLPRLRAMDAPLLMVVGGSTGAGKSTLVNSLVGTTVSAAGVLRPTTRAPVLVCHRAEMRWFEDERVLPGLARTTGDHAASARTLQLVAVDRLAAGLALLDAPDIDSVVETNRELAGQLLAAADSWLFVTTAARYADAVPWHLLQTARDRGTAVSVVLNRIPPGAEEEVVAHLGAMLEEQGLAETNLLTVPEAALQDGLLPPTALAPLRDWFDGLAADAQSRGALVRQTLNGALASLSPRVRSVQETVEEQTNARTELLDAVDDAYGQARDQVDDAMRSGTLLRGEVVARWHDVVGTGDLMRALETRVGWARDRLRSVLTGSQTADAEIRIAVRSSVNAVVEAAADRAAERTVRGWEQRPPGRALLARAPGLDAASPDLGQATAEEVRAWQGHVLHLVREEGRNKRTAARLASLGVNGAGLTVMIAAFASTGGLTGAEIAVAGGTSALSQKVLEAIFGDQAVRTLAERARHDLLSRVDRLLESEIRRFRDLVDPLAPAPGSAERLRDAVEALGRPA
jgi:Dynamin family